VAPLLLRRLEQQWKKSADKVMHADLQAEELHRAIRLVDRYKK